MLKHCAPRPVISFFNAFMRGEVTEAIMDGPPVVASGDTIHWDHETHQGLASVVSVNEDAGRRKTVLKLRRTS
ncbi:MAG: hypothetical protein V4576_04185 [Patescibacteria group bacterium]